VPFIVVDEEAGAAVGWIVADIAPTILGLFGWGSRRNDGPDCENKYDVDTSALMTVEQFRALPEPGKELRAAPRGSGYIASSKHRHFATERRLVKLLEPRQRDEVSSGRNRIRPLPNMMLGG